ncbi:AbfB domain-containing protein [Micromonospora craniellae]
MIDVDVIRPPRPGRATEDAPQFGVDLPERVNVPFPVESALSGVQRAAADNRHHLHYRRTATGGFTEFTVPVPNARRWSPVPSASRIAVLGEFGGLGLRAPGHEYSPSGGFFAYEWQPTDEARVRAVNRALIDASRSITPRQPVALPVGARRSLQVTTHGHTGRYLRHQNGLAYTEIVTDGSTALLKQDATYTIGVATQPDHADRTASRPGRSGRYTCHPSARPGQVHWLVVASASPVRCAPPSACSRPPRCWPVARRPPRPPHPPRCGCCR